MDTRSSADDFCSNLSESVKARTRVKLLRVYGTQLVNFDLLLLVRVYVGEIGL